MSDNEQAQRLLHLLTKAFQETVVGGGAKLSPGVAVLPEADRVSLMEAIAADQVFDAVDDPAAGVAYGEILHGDIGFLWRFAFKPITNPEDFETIVFEFSIKTAAEQTAQIRLLNDFLRRTGAGGNVVTTPGFRSLSDGDQSRLLDAVRIFDKFDADNDPRGEHDFGSVVLNRQTFYWKIDYYDRAMEFGSDDPSDPSVTTRVLTIMTADEY